ncbi:hypothetical protein [Ottowia sp. VDI28]|uniref:hypothetical protein n=1 Tax=Ottowia sp. VDI28 TaxID=3133968 RepID=UPI003C3069F7
MSNTPESKPSVDWERIELDYRAGIKSLREIADGSGTSHVNIAKRAKKLGWVRDLSVKIQAKADELVNKASVNAPVYKASPVNEQQTVEAVAQTQAGIRLAHREDIHRARVVTMALLSEMELQAGPENVALLQELGELMRKPGDKDQDKLNEIYQKIISLPGRAKTMKDLGDGLRNLVALDRQAYGIRDEMPEPPAKGMEQITTAELLAMRAALKAVA